MLFSSSMSYPNCNRRLKTIVICSAPSVANLWRKLRSLQTRILPGSTPDPLPVSDHENRLGSNFPSCMNACLLHDSQFSPFPGKNRKCKEGFHFNMTRESWPFYGASLVADFYRSIALCFRPSSTFPKKLIYLVLREIRLGFKDLALLSK